jgi:hypothetical protein
MANALFDKAREGFLSGQINFSSDNIKAVLVDTALYTPSLTTNQYLSDIASGARVATSANLASKTVTNGVADAADITFSAVTGASVEAIVLYKDTGTAGTSRLICYIDSGVGGIPITPNGGDITTAWNASGIFKL